MPYKRGIRKGGKKVTFGSIVSRVWATNPYLVKLGGVSTCCQVLTNQNATGAELSAHYSEIVGIG